MRQVDEASASQLELLVQPPADVLPTAQVPSKPAHLFADASGCQQPAMLFKF
jgi:hypothetical protein